MAPKWSDPIAHSLSINGNAVEVQVEHGLERDAGEPEIVNTGQGMLRLAIPGGQKIVIPLAQLWELIGGFDDWRTRGAPEATKPEKGGK